MEALNTMKRLLVHLLFLGIAIIAVLSSADAGTLITAPVAVPSGDIISCIALNKTAGTISVTMYLIDGTNGNEFGPYFFTVAPNKTAKLPAAAKAYDYSCKFPTATTSSIRASTSAYSQGRAYIVIPAGSAK